MGGDVLSALSRLFEASAPSGVTSAYCFGSQVTGRAHRDSDVDVAILLDWAAYTDRKGRFDLQLRLAGTRLIVTAPQANTAWRPKAWGACAPPCTAMQQCEAGGLRRRGMPVAEGRSTEAFPAGGWFVVVSAKY